MDKPKQILKILNEILIFGVGEPLKAHVSDQF